MSAAKFSLTSVAGEIIGVFTEDLYHAQHF